MRTNKTDSVVFRYSTFIRIGAFFSLILSLICGIMAYKEVPLVTFLFFIVTLFSSWIIYFTLGEVAVSDYGMKSIHPFHKTRELKWKEINDINRNRLKQRLEFKLAGSEDFYLSEQLEGFNALIEIILKHRFDIFYSDTQKKFHRYLFPNILMFGFGIIFIFFALWLPSDDDVFFSRMFMTIIGLICPSVLIWEIQAIEIEEEKICLKYPFKQKLIPRDKIQNIRLNQNSDRNGNLFLRIDIEKTNGKILRLSGYREGDIKLYASLKKWFSSGIPTKLRIQN